jgi:hypothetical protein
MRCWWRSWALEPLQGAPSSPASPAAHDGVGACDSREARRAEVDRMMAAGWGERIADDWRESLDVLERTFADRGPFDGLLGFSNGAAAAFLLARHAAARPVAFPGLRFVVLAGGYRPEPLALLAPPSLPRDAASAAGPGGVQGGAAAPALKSAAGGLGAPLQIASLHMAGADDLVVTVQDSLDLADCFDLDSRWAAPGCLARALALVQPIFRRVQRVLHPGFTGASILPAPGLTIPVPLASTPLQSPSAPIIHTRLQANSPARKRPLRATAGAPLRRSCGLCFAVLGRWAGCGGWAALTAAREGPDAG